MPDIAYVSNDSCHEARQICDFPKREYVPGVSCQPSGHNLWRERPAKTPPPEGEHCRQNLKKATALSHPANKQRSTLGRFSSECHLAPKQNGRRQKNAVHLYRSERKQERARNSTPFRTSSSILGPRSTKHWREDKRGKSPIGQFFGSQKTKCATLLRAKRESGRAGKPSHLYGSPPGKGTAKRNAEGMRARIEARWGIRQ